MMKFFDFILIDKPEVTSSRPNISVIEGQTGTLQCKVVAANPNTTITWKWFRTETPSEDLHNNGPTYTIPNIERDRSGSYSCTASNSIGTSEASTVIVDVQCKY